jgi:hypothetical protein
VALDVTQGTDKWVSRMQASGTQIQNGVNAVTQAPGLRAAQQVNVWLAKIQASAQKWAKNVAAVSLADWQNAMITRGIPNINAGVTAKQQNYANFAAKFYPYLATGVAKVKAMPKATLQDGINRAVAMIQYNAAYTGGNGRNG